MTDCIIILLLLWEAVCSWNWTNSVIQQGFYSIFYFCKIFFQLWFIFLILNQGWDTFVFVCIVHSNSSTWHLIYYQRFFAFYSFFPHICGKISNRYMRQWLLSRALSCSPSVRHHVPSNDPFAFASLLVLLPFFAGPFVERAIMASHTSEALWFNSQGVLPKQAEEEQEGWATMETAVHNPCRQ